MHLFTHSHHCTPQHAPSTTTAAITGEMHTFLPFSSLSLSRTFLFLAFRLLNNNEYVCLCGAHDTKLFPPPPSVVYRKISARATLVKKGTFKFFNFFGATRQLPQRHFSKSPQNDKKYYNLTVAAAPKKVNYVKRLFFSSLLSCVCVREDFFLLLNLVFSYVRHTSCFCFFLLFSDLSCFVFLVFLN